MQIQVRQFFHPNGRSGICTTDIPDQYNDAYHAMEAAGCELQAEILTTGEVSLTVTNDEEDVDILVIKNGPEVQKALCQLLENARWENKQ